MYNILIADEQHVCREGIEVILTKNFNNINLFKVALLQESYEILSNQNIDLLIYDINTSKENSRLLISSFKEITPSLKILVFTNQDEKIHAIRYVSAGANGFLQKNADEKVFVSAITDIRKIGVFVSDNMRDSVFKFAVQRKIYNPLESLSDREFEVAKLLIRGMGNIEIMNELNIKMSTVSTYKNRIFEKLEINNIVSLFEIFRIYEEFNEH